MKYLYFPGCSLDGTAREYNVSTRALMQALDIDLVELDDWTCCGATAAEGTSRLLSLVLPARNLALAETMNASLDLLVPCSACYLNLKKVEYKMDRDQTLADRINDVLAVEGLRVQNGGRVRHLLDILSRDIDTGALTSGLKDPLKGLKIAPYYGCQCLRPYAVFDDPEKPLSMEPILKALGAEVHPWEMGNRCCGASLMNTKPEVGLNAVTGMLRAAKGADAIVTVCPMCQMNLEAYQKKISRRADENLRRTILYLPQLMGLALGLSAKTVRMDLNLSVMKPFQGLL